MGLLFQEITASNLIKVDFSGRVVSGDYPYNEAGHAIHSAVLKARPDINVALHSHTRAGTAVSAMECGLLSLSQQANEIGNLVCYHRYDVATDNDDECARLGEDLADKWAMIMHNHGLLSVGARHGRSVLSSLHSRKRLQDSGGCDGVRCRSRSFPIGMQSRTLSSSVWLANRTLETPTAICNETGRRLSGCSIAKINLFVSSAAPSVPLARPQLFCAALAPCVWVRLTRITPVTVTAKATQCHTL